MLKVTGTINPNDYGLPTTISNEGGGFTGDTGGGGGGFTLNDIDKYSYTSNSFSVVSQEDAPHGVDFNTDGTKMFIIGLTGARVYSYSLSVGYDLGSTVTPITSFSIISQDDECTDLFFKPDGTKLFISGKENDKIYSYTLTTGFDLTTASYDTGKDLSVTGQGLNPYSLALNDEGTVIFVLINANDTIFQYNLSTGWDLGTASYASKSFVITQETSPRGIDLSPDGTQMIVVGNNVDTVFQYGLTTGWDLDTASYSSISLSVLAQDGLPRGVRYSNDGNKFFLVGDSTNRIFEYSI